MVNELLRQLIYALAEGREGDRHSGSGYAILDSSALIRTIFITSSEHSLAEYARSANESRDEGELARCLKVAATRAGHETVMDRFPENLVDPAERVAWARRQLAQLRDLCKENHGLAIQPFVRYLMQDIPGAERWIREDMEWFTGRYRPSHLSGAAAHAFDNVAMIFAGGSMALEADLLRCDKDLLAAAIWRCTCNSIPESRPQPNPLTRAERDLRVGLRQARVHRSAQDGRCQLQAVRRFRHERARSDDLCVSHHGLSGVVRRRRSARV